MLRLIQSLSIVKTIFCTDVVARLSATSCNDIVDQGGVQVLFELIRHMNHSVASQIITKLAVSVLFSIAKVSTLVFAI